MSSRKKGESIQINGYTKDLGNGRFVGVAIRPFLAVEARSHGEARHKLQQLCHAYLEDAAEDGRLRDVLRQTAPFKMRAEYGLAWLIHNLNHSVEPFQKTCCIAQHA